MRNRVIEMLSVLAMISIAAAVETSFDIPLTVWDVAGVERKQEICSTGVPLPCGLLKEPEDIAVFDAAGKPVPAQFTVLERWRDAGEGRGDLSIRWLLVTFLADVPAGGKSEYRLARGTNPLPPHPVRIEDKGDAWLMGGAKVKKRLYRALPTRADQSRG
ncbi:MAG: hypothetical protein ACUVWX_09045 [Kiritimatiellia bacterium]